MEKQKRKKSYTSRIYTEMEQLTPEEVFCTTSYLNLLKHLARELTDGRFDDVQLYDAPDESRLGWCDGKGVYINYGNGLTRSFPTLMQKHISLVGILGHECGHQNYSDFGLRKTYLDNLLDGIWYPYPPEAENKKEEADLAQMQEYFNRKDTDALALIGQVAAYLHNVLEDVSVEEKMCVRFPGSVRRGISLNRERNVEWIPTLRELLEEKEDMVSILMNLCAQYALSGQINNWDMAESELLETMNGLMPLIRDACVRQESSERIATMNQMLLRVWKYLYEIIFELEKAREEEKQETEQEEEAEESQGNAPDEEQEEQSEEKPNDAEQKQSQESSSKEKNGTSEKEGAQSEAEQTTQDSSNGGKEEERETSSAMQAYLKHLSEHIPKLMADEGHTAPADDTSKGQEEKNETLPIKIVDADGDLMGLLYQLAKNRVNEQVNQELHQKLLKEMDEIAFDCGHEKVQKKVCREYPIKEEAKQQYEAYREQVRRVQRRLASSVLPVLREQGVRTERNLMLGRRIDMRNIANPNGAIYQKRYKGKQIDMAAAVLIDTSGSMQCGRMELSKLAALCLYEFCQKAGIPLIVYGHHTDGYYHTRLEEETVYLHCCAEFEPDENDRYRICSLKPSGANRDGVALRFVGEKLARRPEKQKMLILISDGLPNSNQYKGERAKEDIRKIKKSLTDRGVMFLAAAIGADKAQIQEIYQESFLDISEMERLPVILTRQVVKQIRRN